jgi:hypothetical protein
VFRVVVMLEDPATTFYSCLKTPALLAVWGFRLGFCTALEISADVRRAI